MFSLYEKLTGSGNTQPAESDEDKLKKFEEDCKELRLKCNETFSDEILAAKHFGESSLRRFLRAFGTVDLATTMLGKHDTWRREFAVDRIDASDPDLLDQMSQRKVHLLRAKDINGRPIVHVAVRKHLAADSDLDKLTKFTIYMLEQTVDRMGPGDVETMCIVFDLKGFALANMDYAYLKRLIWLLGRHYPERLGVCLVLNSPMVFSSCWAIIRPWLNEVTASKVTFVSGEEQLATYLDPEDLPPDLD